MTAVLPDIRVTETMTAIDRFDADVLEPTEQATGVISGPFVPPDGAVLARRPSRRVAAPPPVARPTVPVVRVGRLTVSMAVYPEDVGQAESFVVTELTAEGFLGRWAEGTGAGRLPDAPHAAVFVAREAAEVVAAQVVVPDLGDGAAFRNSPFCLEIADLARQGRRVCLAQRPAVALKHADAGIDDELAAACAAYAIELGCTDLLTIVEPWREADLAPLGFARIGPERILASDMPFPGVLLGRALSLDAIGAPAAAPPADHLPGRHIPRPRHIRHNRYISYIRAWITAAEAAARRADDAPSAPESYAPAGARTATGPPAEEESMAGHELAEGARHHDRTGPREDSPHFNEAAMYRGIAVADTPGAERDARLDVNRLRRRLARMRKAGMLDMDGGVTVERATTVEALAEAYSLVHTTFVEKGYIKPHRSGMRIRAFECLPEMATFVARVDGEIVAVTSIVADSPDLGLPSDHAFPDILADLRDEGGLVCEITNLAVARDYRGSSALLRLVQACFAHGQSIGCTNMFITISPGHAQFFDDVCRFEPVGEPRNCSDEVVDIVQAMRLCLTGSERRARMLDRTIGSGETFYHDFYFAGNPFHASAAAWEELASGTFAEPFVLRDLFLQCSEFLHDCTNRELDAIQRRWGDYVFAGVWGEFPGRVAAEVACRREAVA